MGVKKRKHIKREEEQEEEQEQEEVENGDDSGMYDERINTDEQHHVEIIYTKSRREPRQQKSRRRNSTAPAANIVIDDEEEEKSVANSAPVNQFLAGSLEYHIKIPAIELTHQISSKWSRIPVETSNGLVKAAARVLLMKGGRGDKITMEHVRSAMGDYKQLTRAALKGAQQILRDTFGYDVVLTKDPENIYVVNTIKSPALHRILAAADRDAGYRGFCFAVFICIWTSPGRKIDTGALLRNMRKIDPRFAETSIENSVSKKKDSSGIEDLRNASFMTLVHRMVKEGFVKETKDELEPGNIEKKIYEFGPRFYLEIGMKQLATGYFIASNTRIDENIMSELEQLGDGIIMNNAYEDEENGAGGAGAGAGGGGGGEEEKKEARR